VAACAALVGVAALALGIAIAADRHELRASYSVRGALSGIALDLGDADVVVVGAGRRASVGVEHDDRFAFDHAAAAQRSIEDGVFRIRSRCPSTVPHGCTVRYRVLVPDNLPLTIRTGSGSVRLRGYRGSARITTGDGDIDVAGFCGFLLQARAKGAGDVQASTVCAPPQLTLRSTTGAVHAIVPAGRYRVEASTAHGQPVVRGIAAVGEAPFSIQAFSSSGAVVVERGR
jgi:hypothetical protein